VPLPDGTYEDLYGSTVEVAGGVLSLPQPMVVLRYYGPIAFQHEYSLLLDKFSQVELGDPMG
jgi:hypothetical protein